MSGHFEEVSISKADVLTQQPSGLATDREDLKFNFGMRREPKGKLGQRKPFAPAAVKQLMDLKIFYALFLTAGPPTCYSHSFRNCAKKSVLLSKVSKRLFFLQSKNLKSINCYCLLITFFMSRYNLKYNIFCQFAKCIINTAYIDNTCASQ